jgi:hypothetical protein
VHIFMGPGVSWDNFSLVSSANREGTGSEVEVNGGAHIIWDRVPRGIVFV